MQAKMNSRNNKRGRRIRVTKAEIERARQELLREEASRPGPIPRQQMDPRGFWRKGIYHDSYGWSWDLDKNLDTICLGRTEEVLQRESSFRREKENRSCHSKLKTGAPSISGSGAKSVVASFRNLRSLVYLILFIFVQVLFKCSVSAVCPFFPLITFDLIFTFDFL